MLKLHLWGRPKKENPLSSVDATVLRIKAGDKYLKEKLIEDYKPFILKSVSKVTGKYIDVDRCDEFSIGLLAFNEAVECFDKSKNCSFLSFCDKVISKRVIDYIRKNKKNSEVYPFTYFENTDQGIFEEKYLCNDLDKNFERIETQEEIFAFEKKVAEFGITLDDLVLCSPKHKDSRIMCIDIAKIISANDYLFERLIRRKNIPMVDLMKLLKVNQRTVERNRKFIIAVCLILRSNLDVLKSHIANTYKGGNPL